jgi:hypothetical protein
MDLINFRNLIAQRIIDMHLLEKSDIKPVEGFTFEEVLAIVREVNDTTIIGHALRISEEGRVVKYRKTTIEKRLKL